MPITEGKKRVRVGVRASYGVRARVRVSQRHRGEKEGEREGEVALVAGVGALLLLDERRGRPVVGRDRICARAVDGMEHDALALLGAQRE